MATSVPTIIPPSEQRSFSVLEGAYRPGPWWTMEGIIPAGSPWNYWQCGIDPIASCNSAMVEGCVSAYAQTIAMCPGDHWLQNDKGGRTRQTNSALTRILRKPNSYQSISDFMLNLVRCLYLDGNAYAVALRNNRFEISELHLMSTRSSGARVAPNGDVFYYLGGNEIVERAFGNAGADKDVLHFVPARDVLHIRLHTPRHPLKGESPLLAAALDIATSNAMLRQQLSFYLNQARPSTVLSTDLMLNKEQTDQLRERWTEQSRGLNAGGTPILTGGLKPLTISTSPEQAQLADLMKYTEQQVALTFRIPLQVLGIGGTPLGSTEALMSMWKANGLGFALNHIEEAFGNLFGLKGQPEEYLEFNTSALLRSSQKEFVDMLVSGIKGGTFKVDEARAELGLPRVPGGDEIRVQQQDVPLDWWSKQDFSKTAVPPMAPKQLPAPADTKDTQNAGAARSGEWATSLLRAADAHDRHAS